MEPPIASADWVTIHKSVPRRSDLPLRRGATMDQSMAVRGRDVPCSLDFGGGKRAQRTRNGRASVPLIHSARITLLALATATAVALRIWVQQRVSPTGWAARQRRESPDRLSRLRNGRPTGSLQRLKRLLERPLSLLTIVKSRRVSCQTNYLTNPRRSSVGRFCRQHRQGH